MDILIAVAFTPGQKNVGSSELNAAINDAVIQPAFFTGKAADTAPDRADIVLVYDTSAGSFKKVTLANLIFDHSELLTGRTSVTPANDDSVLIYDLSALGYRKTTIGELMDNGLLATFINGKAAWTTPLGADELLIYDTAAAVNKKVTRANLFYQWWNILNLNDAGITELSGANSVQEADVLLLSDASDANATKKVKIGGILKFLTAGTDLADADQLLIYDASAAGGRSILGSAVKTYVKPFVQTGCIVQVLQAQKTDTEVITGAAAWQDITGLSQSITTRDANSKVLVRAVVNLATNNVDHHAHIRLVRDATEIGVHDAVGAPLASLIEAAATGTNQGKNVNDLTNLAIEWLDSPASASPVAYKVQVYCSNDAYINRVATESDNDRNARGVSVLTVQEVAA